jgi:hypothetical protein
MSFFKWKFACCEYWDELLRKYADNVFCVLSRSVKCDLKNAIQICSLQKLFETIHSRDHAWSSHRQFFWSLSLILDEWRMLILDYRVTYVYSRFVERRLWWDVTDETSQQIWRERLIKLDEWKRHLIKWRKRFIKLDEWKRHFIKFDESDSSNLMTSFYQTFEKKDNFFTFWWVIFCSEIWYEELNLAENHHFVRR